MDREEVKQILIVLEIAFPNFQIPIEKKKATVELWERTLKDFNYHDVDLAVQSFINSSGSAFAPSLPQIVDMLHKTAELSTITEGEAWSLVSKALRNSTYHSQEEFDKLPEDVQKAVGAPSQLYAWATDENFAESVVMSNFQRSYNIVVKRRLEVNKMPQEVRARIEAEHLNILGIAEK